MNATAAAMPQTAVPQIHSSDLQTTVPKACGNRRAAKKQSPETIAAQVTLRRTMDILALPSDGQESFTALYPEGYLEIDGHRAHAYIYSGLHCVLIIFNYFDRYTGEVISDVVNGRTVYANRLLSRRVLVDEMGTAWTEIDGTISRYAKKYQKAANDVMARRAKKG